MTWQDVKRGRNKGQKSEKRAEATRGLVVGSEVWEWRRRMEK
jgi:hypothetical protein